MAIERSALEHYVAVFVPTKDRRGRPLKRSLVGRWRQRLRQTFRRFVEGSYIAPVYRIEGDYKADDGQWILEPNEVVKAYGTAAACERLLRGLEEADVEGMLEELDQEAVAIESSLEGLVIYRIEG